MSDNPWAAPQTGAWRGAPPGQSWPAGWYADPWFAGHFRYWTGSAWTPDVVPAPPPSPPGAWTAGGSSAAGAWAAGASSAAGGWAAGPATAGTAAGGTGTGGADPTRGADPTAGTDPTTVFPAVPEAGAAEPVTDPTTVFPAVPEAGAAEPVTERTTAVPPAPPPSGSPSAPPPAGWPPAPPPPGWPPPAGSPPAPPGAGWPPPAGSPPAPPAAGWPPAPPTPPPFDPFAAPGTEPVAPVPPWGDLPPVEPWGGPPGAGGAGTGAGVGAYWPPAPASRRKGVPWVAVLAVVLVVLLVSALVTVAVRSSTTKKQASPPATTAPSTTGAPRSTDPDAAVLPALGLRQADVVAPNVVSLIPGGDGLGDPTLDLCAASFPSESLRTARRQVEEVDGQGNGLLSTESVLYVNAGGTAQGFTELRAAAAACPKSAVPDANGTPTTTTFNPPPDGTWPQVTTVERLAYDFTTSTTQGSNRTVAVYLRRGRVLMGLYFFNPAGSQSPVGGQTTVEGIVTLFANRMAALPQSVINRTVAPASRSGSGLS